MRKTLRISVLLCVIFSCMSCHFLDVDPELGITEEQVFSTYSNYKKYFDYIYYKDSDVNKLNLHCAYPMFTDFNDRRFAFVSTTDAADPGRMQNIRAFGIKNGQMIQETVESFTTDVARRPLMTAMFKVIRIANRSIENIDRLTNAKPAEKADLLGSAYFARAYAHFALCRFMGGMPYIAESQKDDWDLPRLSSHETFTLAAQDFYRAYELLKEAGKMRRDARPGMAGHGASTEFDKPSGCAALAMRAMSLMYAASALSNVNGVADWEAAAEAYGLALTTALDWGYALLPAENYTDNFYGKETTNETLWGYCHQVKGSNSSLTAILAYPQSGRAGACGICPTQNFVDKYETIYGDPLNTAEDRAAAVAAGHYNEQDPYSNRDPRFELTILHDMSVSPNVEGYFNIHYDPVADEWPITTISGTSANFGIAWGTKEGTDGYSNTGYYLRKQWRGAHGSVEVAYIFLDPLVRLGEMYLSYAECVNEAFGPDGKTSNCTMTAINAVNAIRTRIGMPQLREKYTADADVFRERIRNERNVELAYEGNHYYFDIRRWKIAPQVMSQPLVGMYVQLLQDNEKNDAKYPNGRKYERREIPANRQCSWKDYMYYWPVPDEEADKLMNFQNIYRWQ